MNKKTIVNAQGEVIAYSPDNFNIDRATNGIRVGYYNRIGNTLYASFCSPLDGQTTGKLIPQADGTLLLTD